MAFSLTLIEPENLSAAAGVLLSLAVRVIPGLNDRWDRLAAETKQGFMLLLSAVAAVGIVFWSCQGAAVCLGGVSWFRVGEAVIFATVANQGIHRGTPESWFRIFHRRPPASPAPADLGKRPYPPGSYPRTPPRSEL